MTESSAFMNEFTISRIHTDLGIFRISGLWEKSKDNLPIKVLTIDMMGSDGWVRLDNNNEHNLQLISALQHQVGHHLRLNLQ